MRKLIFCMFAILLISLGCGDTTQDVTTPGTSNPTGTVQGFVRDYKTNAPIENVTVTLYATGTRTTTTDAVGYWYFNNVPAGEEAANLVYTLTAPDADADDSADYLPMLGTTALDESVGTANPAGGGGAGGQVGQSNSLATVVDWMVQTATVSGFVTDSTSGQGINAATVVIQDFTAGFGAGNWGAGASNARVDSVALTTTTAARTEGGDGYYSFTTVPALTMNTNDFGAYATGYEYAAPNVESSLLNLQFGSSAIVDFQLNPLDNNLGLVVASVTTATGTTTNMLILTDATGNQATGAVTKVDMNGATQLVFNLIFDQPIETTSFYGDTIQLRDNTAVVGPNLTPVWTTGNYALTLTGNIDIFDDIIENPYTLVATRSIRPSTGAAAGQIAAWVDTGVANVWESGEGGGLAQFIAYNSTHVATNPTPALFLDLGDTSIVGDVNVNIYDASSQVNPTTAQSYTGIYEENVLNKYTFTANTLAAQIDIYWTDASPVYDVSATSYYVRERDPVSGEVLKNWTKLAAPTTFQADDRFIAMNLNVIGAITTFYGGSTTTLRYGDALDIAVVLDDTLGVENAIDTAKILTLTDGRAPEITGFTGTLDYDNQVITFNEIMSATGMSVSASNSALFTVSPEWDQDVMNRLRINAVAPSAATASVSLTAADPIVIAAGLGVITFDTAGDADLFFVTQVVTVTYLNGEKETTNVTAIDTATPTITINTAGLALTGSDFTQVATLTVSGTTPFRSGFAPVAFGSPSATDTDITCTAGSSIAVGDTLILRVNGEVNLDTSVTVLDFNSTTGVATLTAATDTLTLGYNQVIFPGDVFTVTATDEAGNAMHTDANEITTDTGGDIWPLTGNDGNTTHAIR